MNDRISKLALDAAEHTNWKPGLSNEHVQEYMAKFAELVVKECVAVIEAKKNICGSGIPDRVVLDMTVKDIHSYMGVAP